MTVVRRLAAVLLVVVLLAGCSPHRQEPGLFGRPDDASETPIAPGRTEAPTAALPVAADATWTSNDGLGVTVRMAVHAIRRTAGATVLDWSLTPLSAAGLNVGDPVPPSVTLGLQRFGDGDTNVFLLDPERGRVYRPLVSDRGDGGHCLCTPVWFAQRSLVIGRTRLLQLTFPPLPAGLDSVDVLTSTTVPMTGIAVTPAGRVPAATVSADLTRPVDIHPARATSQTFSYRGRTGAQQYIAFVDDVVGGDSLTGLRWIVQSITDGDGLQGLPPISSDRTDAYTSEEASGPVLRVGGRTLTAQLVTTTLDGRGTLECLCSTLQPGYGASRQINARVTLLTTFPKLPRGTRQVEVVLAGLRPMTVPVTPAVRRRTGVPVDAGLPAPSWTYDPRNLPAGWEVDRWPTPLPDPTQLGGYRHGVDRLR